MSHAKLLLRATKSEVADEVEKVLTNEPPLRLIAGKHFVRLNEFDIRIDAELPYETHVGSSVQALVSKLFFSFERVVPKDSDSYTNVIPRYAGGIKMKGNLSVIDEGSSAVVVDAEMEARASGISVPVSSLIPN